jgi:hypothetical protein
VAELGFKGSQAGVEQFAFRDDDDVEAWRELVATKDLSNQSFSSISLDRAAQFPRGGDSQPAHRQIVREREQRQIAAVRADAAVVNLLIFRAAADAFVRPKTGRTSCPASAGPSYRVLTVRRLRPFARRRFSTKRPFFVLIRTRNPWVRLRWRVLG